ncbi:MAG TPA: SCO family protein [Anaerolineaceae bacterium]|nr:SCO family protein [Anaerolineaceae bacterium]
MFGYKGIWLTIGLAALAGVFLLGASILNRPYHFRGSVIEPALSAPQLHLVDQKGKLFQLSEARGKVVLLFFGYTNCPEECPTTLAQFRQIYSDLGNQADQVQMLFVTVDPIHDTPQQLGSYLTQFKSNMIGLTGSPEELTAVWKAYGVYVEVPEWGYSSPPSQVAHSNVVYAIDRRGNLRLTYTYGTPTDDMLQDVRALVKEG